MEHRHRPVPRRRGRGITLIGLLFWAGLIGFVAYLLVRTVPTVNEFYTIKRVVNDVAAANPPTVADVRRAFERQREIEYSITSITGKDLSITKENDRVVVSFAYDKEIPIYGPVFLLLKYEGRSK